MRSEGDDRNAREMIRPILQNAGFKIISIRGIDEGEYWVHLKKEISDSMRDEYTGKVSQ